MLQRQLLLLDGIPLVSVHHIAGHIYANRLVKEMEFPLLALVVSGGHTELVYMKEHGHFEVIGETRDDAAGEAYDKVARTLHLPYPGGPQIDQLAQNGEANIDLPRAWLKEGPMILVSVVLNQQLSIPSIMQNSEENPLNRKTLRLVSRQVLLKCL